MASDLHRTATTVYLCCVPALEDSTGAGRVGLAGANIQSFCIFAKAIANCKIQLYIVITINKTMKKHNLLAFILLGAVAMSCDGGKNSQKNLFKLDTTGLKQLYHPNETFPLGIENPKNATIDSVIYYINDTKVGSVTGNTKLDFKFENEKFGYKNIKALVYSDGDNSEVTGRVELGSGVTPTKLEYELVNTYPHDMQAYTQGLEFYRDTLIESTGRRGLSTLRKTNYKTGEVYKKTELEGKYFGEGITVVDNKIYMLTWQSRTGFVYNADTFERLEEFKYFKEIEGWGLTHDDSKYIYMSDGTEKIWKLDPKTLEEIDYVNVYTTNSKIKSVNELEWIEGKIYGNVYQTDGIAVIDPATGAVEHILDISPLKKQVTMHPDMDVLNGIAYNPKTKTIFITGKNWDKMFEIRVKQ